MADLKLDLLNKLRNDKYFAEIELVRLAQDPTMNYKGKIDEMEAQLALIALLNTEMGLVEQYFQDQPPAEGQPAGDGSQQPMPNLNPNAPAAAPAGAPVPAGAPAAKVHPGQSHGE